MNFATMIWLSSSDARNCGTCLNNGWRKIPPLQIPREILDRWWMDKGSFRRSWEWNIALCDIHGGGTTQVVCKDSSWMHISSCASFPINLHGGLWFILKKKLCTPIQPFSRSPPIFYYLFSRHLYFYFSLATSLFGWASIFKYLANNAHHIFSP